MHQEHDPVTPALPLLALPLLALPLLALPLPARGLQPGAAGVVLHLQGQGANLTGR